MSHLATDLRNLLEKTVVEARDVAELGARAALEALGVSDGKVHAHLKPDERDLRVRLRARARQLGDPLDAKTQVQAIDHLVREVAYEHWHRMLFARFLAESHLLVEPESSVAVSLEECRELARERNEDPWALAGRFAERMLPAIFRSNDPALALALPPERLNRLEALLEALPAEVFAADDALGWVYQFWQSKRKKEVNLSGRKIGADELPVVTQLFTEPYMVQFLLHNTLGAWHAGKVFAARPELATSATSEEELRRACALPGYEWTYLRFVRDPAETGLWRPAAGTFPGWPARAAEVSFLDPCCGSGHFLVEALAAFVALRRNEEKLSPHAAIASVIRDNLHGLELDPRCTQIAAFAVALTAWRKLGRIEPLPPVQIACSGLAVGVPKSEWLKVAGGDAELLRGMERLYELFQKGTALGSLLDPRSVLRRDLFSAPFERLEQRLLEVISEGASGRDPFSIEIAVAAAGLSEAAKILVGSFSLIATNFPFLGLEKQDAVLGDYLKEHHPSGKRDLSTSFLLRSSVWSSGPCTTAAVLPGEWTYLRPHRFLRQELLGSADIPLIALLGRDAFQSGLRAAPALTIVNWRSAAEKVFVLDARESAFVEKPTQLQSAEPKPLSAEAWLASPDSRLSLDSSFHGAIGRLGMFAEARLGLTAGDGVRFERQFWELPHRSTAWEFLQTSTSRPEPFSGRSGVVFWQQERGEIWALAESVKHLNHSAQNWQRGRPFWGRDGVVVSQMGDLASTLYTGERYDCRCLVLMPKRHEFLGPIAAFCLSGALSEAVRSFDDGLKIGSPQTLLDAPFDLAEWSAEAESYFADGVPEPWSKDPTQWVFHGHPGQATDPLQVAVARLLGYQWPAELDSTMRLSADARDCVNRTQGLAGLADCDGIVCLSSLRNEESAAARLRTLLAAAVGDEWGAAKERNLLAATPGQASSLEEWLRDRFFEEHCALFYQRPFVWHLWDGRKDGFHALVNYHRLADGSGKGRQLLESLAYAYLGEWIDRQRRGATAGETGAEARLAAAVELQGELKKILDGEAPYDIFVRWKPLHRQPIGWEPDIDDGVRLNARPFLTASLSAGRTGAGLFRAKPNIHWRKDRGVETQREHADFPWLYGNDGSFHGERHNDLHLSLEEKLRARDKRPKGRGQQ